jgi:hypothetical protein
MMSPSPNVAYAVQTAALNVTLNGCPNVPLTLNVVAFAAPIDDALSTAHADTSARTNPNRDFMIGTLSAAAIAA